jgi:hypothetical protein
MATINASTTLLVKKTVAAAPKPKATTTTTSTNNKPKQHVARRGAIAPLLKPNLFSNESAVYDFLNNYTDNDARTQRVQDLFRAGVCGEASQLHLDKPHAASTTRDRGTAAADLATLARTMGVAHVLKTCGILQQVTMILFPQGVQDTMKFEEQPQGGGLKPSRSALSLASMDTANTGGSVVSDTKRGKTTPANAREGCLLFLRALCQIVQKPAEPYVVGAYLAAALDECSSSNGAVREAAEDASVAIVALANPWVFSSVLSSILIQTLTSSPEWRVKTVALERLEQCAGTAPEQVYKLVPDLIPAITSQVWDTKQQVSKAARSALLAICDTNTNPDIKRTIPAIVNAIAKPADTNKAVTELMGTTFVVPVDAPTLAMLVPVLARALKEKLAIHKRAACIVISNMSKLVETPEAVAPFGSLLVPELKKVSENVQFEEIRDEALRALENLTKALGDAYTAAAEVAVAQAEKMHDEHAKAEAEQERIKKEKEELLRLDAEMKRKEEEERKRFKEAMDAQRQLDLLAAKEVEEQKKADAQKKEMQKLSTKGEGGQCQSCGLKKCKKSCMFYAGK